MLPTKGITMTFPDFFRFVGLSWEIHGWIDRVVGQLALYSKDPDNRPLPTNRPPYQILAILIATFTVFAALYRPSPVAPRVPGGLCPPGVPQGPLGEEV